MPRNEAIKVAKNTVALSISKASVPFFSIAFVIFAARLLGVSEFGKYVIVLTFFQLFLGLCGNGLSVVVTREVAKRPSAMSQYLTGSVLLVSALAIASNALLISLGHILAYAADTKAAMYLAGVALLPATVSVMLEAIFVAFEKAEYVSYGVVLESIVRLGVSILMLLEGYGLLMLFVILVTSQSLLVVLYVVFVNYHVSKWRWDFEWAFLKKLVVDWKVFALENWLFKVFYSLNVIILSFVHGERVVGLYGAAYKMLNPANVFANSFAKGVFPYMSRLFDESREKLGKISEYVLKYIFVILLFGALMIGVLADRLVILIYTDAYAGSIPILRVLAWVLIPLCVNPFLSHMLFAQGEQRKALHVAVICLVVYVPVSWWLITQWGGIGAAWALLLSLGVAFGLYLVYCLGVQGTVQALWMVGRTAAAGVGCAAFLVTFKGIHMMTLISGGVVLYGLLLVILRVPSPSDIDLARQIARRGLHRMVTIGRA